MSYTANNWPADRWPNFSFAEMVCSETGECGMGEATMDRLWIVGDGTVSRYDGDLEDYKKLILSGSRSGGGASGGAGSEPVEIVEPQVSKVDQRRQAAERREAVKPLKKKISQLEIQISRLQKTIADLDEKLADPALYTQDLAKATSLNKQRAEAAKTLESCEEDWLGLTAEHDAAMAAE